MSSLSGIENHLERCLDLEDHEILEYIESKQLDEELRKALLQRLGIVSEDEVPAFLKPSEVEKPTPANKKQHAVSTNTIFRRSEPTHILERLPSNQSTNQSRTPD